MKYAQFALGLLLLFFGIGCSSSKIALMSKQPISYDDVRQTVDQQQEKIHSLYGEGRISVESPVIAQTGSFTLFLRKPDSILIKLQGPFGIKVGFALVTKDEFVFYNSFDNKIIRGKSNQENLDRILHVRINFSDMLHLFSGGSFYTDDNRTPDSVELFEDHWTFLFKHAESRHVYWIDPETRLIQRIQDFDRYGTLLLERRFSNFRTIDGTNLPFAIRLSQPIEQQSVSFRYSDVTLNSEEWQFNFSTPSSAEEIHW